MEMTILERVARPDGTPPRCIRCNAVCEPSLSGPVLCSDHRPRWVGGVTAAQAVGNERSRQAAWAAAKRKQRRRDAPVVEAIPVAALKRLAAEVAPRTYRERVNDRLKARGLV